MGPGLSERGGNLAAGFAALQGGRLLVLLLTVVTVLLAVLSAAPLVPALQQSFAGTLAGDHILKNHPSFAPTDVIDFLREKAPAVAGSGAAERWAALIGLLQQILFAGGIVAVLGRAVPISLPDFVAGVRRNAWHNVKCFLVFLLLAGAALGIWFGVTHALSSKLFEGSAPGSTSATLFKAAVAVGGLILYAVLSLLQDFARAARRDGSPIGAWRSYGRARRILSGRWMRAFGLFLFWLLFGGALLLSGIALEWSAPAVSALAIALHILIQVAVLAVRSAVRVAAWGSYLHLYDGAKPAAPPPIAAPEAEPPAPRILSLDETTLF
jgi:hypothetical protein